MVAKGSSDSAALDAVFELLLRGGRDLPMVKTMMIPEAIDVSADNPRANLYAYCNSVMEPWDGPAAIAAYAGDWVVAGLDRNGLRPLRYVVTHDGLVIAGSETGMVVVPDTNIAERGRLGPGEMIGINLAEGRLYKDQELKNKLVQKMRLASMDWSGQTNGRAVGECIWQSQRPARCKRGTAPSIYGRLDDGRHRACFATNGTNWQRSDWIDGG